MRHREGYAQCKTAENRKDPTGAALGMVFDAPVVMQRQVLGVGQRRETVEVPQLQSVQFLEVVDVPVVLMTTGALLPGVSSCVCEPDGRLHFCFPGSSGASDTTKDLVGLFIRSCVCGCLHAHDMQDPGSSEAF